MGSHFPTSVAALAPILLSAACLPGQVRVVVHPSGSGQLGLERAEGDLVRLLGEIPRPPGLAGVTTDPGPAACSAGAVHVVVAGVDGALARQEVRIVDERCGDGRVVTLSGGGEQSAQWAVYDLLRAVGVRFFHPEETFLPPALSFPDDDLTSSSGPAFVHRSFHAHRTHPIELSAPRGWLDEEESEDFALMKDIQERWIDWNVAMKANTVDGYDSRLVGDYAYERGFEPSSGLNLLNTQQGGMPVLDPDDPRPEEDQLAEAIDLRMVPDEDGRVPRHFGVQFNPSEFTEADDEDTVRRLTFISEHLTAHYPDVLQWTTNHGTAAEPTDTYGIRFFDLPKLAPPELGVKIHTLMFYDLERPAHVYGNITFESMLTFAREEAAVRRIQHYPESSWWLTFDLPVPLYLAPVTMEARQHDVDLLKDLLSAEGDTAGIYGHHIFTSGQEWGYWLIDWCFAHQSWSTDTTHDVCLADFTGLLEGGEVILEVLKAVERRQVDDMRNRHLVRFLVGSDDETEIAFDAGIDFHPLPPHPKTILGYDDFTALHLEQRSLRPLREMAADYLEWADKVAATLPRQSETQARYVREIRDGLEVFGLRAAHAATVYETALALREALLAGDVVAISEAYDGVEAARALTDAAREVIHRREEDYRYPPELTIHGDEPGEPGAVENDTIYPYRYLSRTHRLFYWTRPDDQLATLFGEGLELVSPGGRILRAGTPLDIELLVDDVDVLTLDYGDGTLVEADRMPDAPHVYAAGGLYSWVLDVTSAATAVHHEDTAAVVGRRFVFPKGSLRVDYPGGASAIEGLTPGFVMGTLGGDEGQLVLGTVSARVEDVTRVVADHGSVQTRIRQDLVSGPADLALELKDVGLVRVSGATLALTAEGGTARLDISGEIDTGEVIDLLVSVGGFEPTGARGLVATLLEYTPESLPPREPFELHADGIEDLN